MIFNRIMLILTTLVFCLSCTTKTEAPCNDSDLIEFAKVDDLPAFKNCIAHGSDIYLVDDKGENLYHIARKSGAKSITDYLTKTQLEEWDSNSNPLVPEMLYKAINFNNTTIVNSFIVSGFDVESKYFNGISPIIEAIFADSYEVVALLLEGGVNVHYQFDFRPLITIATMFNQPETVELLLLHGADINDIDGAGVSSLIFAAQDNNAPMVKLLLSHGANKQLEDVTGRSALDYISYDSHTTLASLLSE